MEVMVEQCAGAQIDKALIGVGALQPAPLNNPGAGFKKRKVTLQTRADRLKPGIQTPVQSLTLSYAQ